MNEESILLFDADGRKAENFKGVCVQCVETDAENQSSSFKKQRQILTEIYQTEITYILQLEILIKFFLQPLTAKSLMEQTHCDIIFSNILQLHSVNKELFSAIREDTLNVALAFKTFAPFLKLYSIYAYNYKRGAEILEGLLKEDKKLYTFVKNQETRPEVKATLISLLIAPIQRVPRYRLLLRSLLEASDPEAEQFNQIKEALDSVEGTADHINRLITESEEGERLINLALKFSSKESASIVVPGRKLLRDGVVCKSTKGLGTSRRYLALFNDSLLICKGSTNGPLSSPTLLPLRHMTVEPALGSAVFRVVCREKDMLLYTDDASDGAQWISAIQEAISNHMKCHRTLRKESSKTSMLERRRVTRTSKSSAILQQAMKVCRKIGLSKPKRLQNHRTTRRRTT